MKTLKAVDYLEEILKAVAAGSDEDERRSETKQKIGDKPDPRMKTVTVIKERGGGNGRRGRQLYDDGGKETVGNGRWKRRPRGWVDCFYSHKASLLAEVVRRLRSLKKITSEFAATNDSEISQSNLFPTECDKLNFCHSELNSDTSSTIKATLCCEDRPELISDITAAVKEAEGKAVRVEMATVGGRTKSILWVQFMPHSGGGPVVVKGCCGEV
ncbi:hypothetical protein Vadar_008328 [Vaccinium darrowii]|uniref:Uncharacterized protein n=1 Tax=Vaccinium darrowii TaxID=229202 RepID=A0ACB7YDS1_9ERIC|nr:hypothetical protein Vadar_008328 [Vaccinium darrowii]